MAAVAAVAAVVVVVENEGGGRWRRGAPFEDGVAFVTDAGAWSGPGERVFRPARY
jgi:hypothetical protein